MPPPLLAQQLSLTGTIPFIVTYESPIQLRMTSIIDQVSWNCLAVYEETPLDILTRKEPIVRADTDTINQYSTPETKLQCTLYVLLPLLNYLVPEAVSDTQSLFNSWGMDPPASTEINPAVVACGVDDIPCLQTVASSNNYEPEVMASIIALQAIEYLENDGWNADGLINRNGDGQCTANCRPYSDITGYAPVDIKGKSNDDRWEQLQEDDRTFFHVLKLHAAKLSFVGYVLTSSLFKVQ